MNEDSLFFATLAGLALILVSWVWLVIVAWRQRPGWGLAILLFPPAGLLFAIGHLETARGPFILGLVGLIAAAGPPVVNRLLPLDLGPRDTLVDGERHITLTGWDRQDYGALTLSRTQPTMFWPKSKTVSPAGVRMSLTGLSSSLRMMAGPSCAISISLP